MTFIAILLKLYTIIILMYTYGTLLDVWEVSFTLHCSFKCRFKCFIVSDNEEPFWRG